MTKSADFYSFRHGQFGITVLTDGYIELGGEIFAPEAKPEEREAILLSLGGGRGSAHAQSNIPLIDTGTEFILVDVGAGELFQPSEGKLEENLLNVGVEPQEITIVVISHAHPDHLWGMIKHDGSLRFPNAKYFISREEWDFWTGDRGGSLPESLQPFVAGARRDLLAISERVTFVDDGDEIVPGLRVLATPGHTAGHISLELEGDDPLIITVDASASEVVSMQHPEWSFGFDMDPKTAVETRRMLLDKAVSKNAKLLGFHWTYPGIGRIEQNGDSYRFHGVSALSTKS
jgi:glyoxylase-like metal-dependent hydrolase (beta-lactamase superfamily II)